MGEGSPAKQCLGHHVSFYLAEMLLMQMLHSALGEPLCADQLEGHLRIQMFVNT